MSDQRSAPRSLMSARFAPETTHTIAPRPSAPAENTTLGLSATFTTVLQAERASRPASPVPLSLPTMAGPYPIRKIVRRSRHTANRAGCHVGDRTFARPADLADLMQGPSQHTLTSPTCAASPTLTISASPGECSSTTCRRERGQSPNHACRGARRQHPPGTRIRRLRGAENHARTRRPVRRGLLSASRGIVPDRPG